MVDIDNSDCAAYAAVQPVDSGHPNTAAGKQAAGPVLKLTCDSSGPTLCDSAPSHAPSADPSVEARSTASRGSRQAVAGSTSQVHAG